MIEKKTVLVLGAGASKPYGFPTGGELQDEISAVLEAEKFDRFLSVSEGISRLISNRDLGFSHDSTPALVPTLSSGVSAVP